MAIALVSSTAELVTTANSITINKPNLLAVGHVLLAYISTYAAGSGDSMATPAGWTRDHNESGPSNHNGYLYWKIADSSDVAASNFAFSTTSSGNNDTIAGLLAAYSGVDASPIHQSAYDSDSETSTTTATIPGVTTTVNDAEIVTFASIGVSTVNWDNSTPPSGFNQVNHATGSQEADPSMFTKSLALAGSTGNLTFTTTASATFNWVGGTVALLPDGAGGGGGGGGIVKKLLLMSG